KQPTCIMFTFKRQFLCKNWSALVRLTSAESQKVIHTATFPGVIPYIIDELCPVPSARAYSSCFIPDPTSLHSVRSLYFKLNANSQTQPHFVRLGPCISNSMLIPRPNLTSFNPTSLHSVRSLYFKLNAKSQTQPHFVRSLYFKLNANSQTQPHFVQLGLCISNSVLHPRPNLTSFDPTSLCSVRSLYFKLNAKSQTQPHFVRLGPCISNSMLSPRPNLTSFG
ncbi:hypothetical protein E4T56_gene4622, partial [Termitomyces sp. T112]